MEVRILKPQEKFDARLIAALAFHQRMSDPEKARQDSEKDPVEDWGAFDEDGRLMAHILHHRFSFRLDGQWIPGGGIGAVSTLPEYRDRGAVRAIFGELLRQAYREGQVLSALYPFNHAFYRKFGYETVRWRDEYCFPPAMLREYRFTGRAVQWKPGDPVGEYTALYEKFASGFNLAVRRDDRKMLESHMDGEWAKDRKFSYLLYDGDRPAAYLTFQDVRHDPAAILSVQDYAWDGKNGFHALLGFLARFSADYGTIQISLPACLGLASVIHAPDAYDLSQTGLQDYMVRVVNAQKLLEILCMPEDCSYTVRVSDPLIPENNGTWLVRKGAAVPADTLPDLAVTVQALGQLAAGCVSLPEAKLREDVQVNGNEETLRRVFVRKPVLVADHY